MAKLEKQYPPFECVEYDYGHLSRRDYEGPVYVTLKFADSVDLYVYFYFREFLDFHKRKKSPLHRAVERLLTEINGWGSRHFELIERLQAEESLDLFQLFAEYIEFVEEELAEQYETRRYKIEEMKSKNLPFTNEPLNNSEDSMYKKELSPSLIEDDTSEEEEEEEDEESPYDLDRKKFQQLLEQGSNDMYDALKINFFPQMAYFQRRYPNKWKSLNENLEEFLQSFEDQLLDAMLPALDDDEYREFDIKYNSEKANMSDEDEPPTAR